MIAEVGSTMLGVGLLLGFVGAGGSGFIISILTVVFGISIHLALGTAIAAMVFSSLSGAISHYREGNVHIPTGLVTGLFGAVGAFVSSKFSSDIPGADLKFMTAGMLFLSSACLAWRLYQMRRQGAVNEVRDRAQQMRSPKYWLAAIGIGIVTGALSGMFGIGSTPFIQIGLMMLLGMTPREAAGNTMMVIVPIAVGGGVGYLHMGYLDPKLLAAVVAGTMLGAYVGAKFTRRLPSRLLKSMLVALPIIGGGILFV